MSENPVKELLVYKKDILLKSATADHLEEHEYLSQMTRYNESGKVILDVHYDSDGKVVHQFDFEYDQNGFLTSEKMKDEYGDLAEHKTFENNEKGITIREFRHYADNSFDTITFTYNDKGQIVRKEVADPDGEMESIEEFTYEGDLLTGFTITDADGDLVAERSVIYNEKGQPIEISESDAMEDVANLKKIEYHPSGNRKETLTWNEDGKLVEKVITKENEAGQIVEVTEETSVKKNTISFSYDAAGNVVFQEETDRNGELVSRIKRTFADNNQILSSEVFISGSGKGISRNYTLRNEYVRF